MNPPQRVTARLTEITQHNDKFLQFFFEYVQPPTVAFKAGQYASIQVSEHGDRRSYSVSSSPDVTHGFELLVDISPGGVGSQFMQHLKEGDTINALLPLGVFTIADAADEAALQLVATGSGITPFHSMVLDLLQVQHDPRPITLYWGMRQAEYLFWLEEFQDLMDAFPNFSFHPVISQPVAEWTLCRGRVTDCLSVHELPANAGYYLCGNQHMIKDCMALLTAKGVPATHIHHEKFF